MDRMEQEWVQALDDLMMRVGDRFARSESWERAKNYIKGLLGPVERKNSWQLAEMMGETTPYGL